MGPHTPRGRHMGMRRAGASPGEQGRAGSRDVQSGVVAVLMPWVGARGPSLDHGAASAPPYPRVHIICGSQGGTSVTETTEKYVNYSQLSLSVPLGALFLTISAVSGGDRSRHRSTDFPSLSTRWGGGCSCPSAARVGSDRSQAVPGPTHQLALTARHPLTPRPPQLTLTPFYNLFTQAYDENALSLSSTFDH